MKLETGEEQLLFEYFCALEPPKGFWKISICIIEMEEFD